MSIIGSPTVVPNRLEMLINFIRDSEKKYTKNELEVLFSPTNASESEDNAVFNEVYGVASLLELFLDDEQDKGSPKITLNIKIKNKKIRSYILDKIFEKEFTHKDTFSYALAWFLQQNPKNPIDRSDNIKIKVTNDLNNNFGDFGLTNYTKSQIFFYWCEYLGFSRKITIGSKTYVFPDPTQIMEEMLLSLFEKNDELSVEMFLMGLSKQLPVFETGWIRDEIEAKTIASLLRTKGTLSDSTSLALLRLEDKGKIKLLSKSDAEIFPLNGISKNITHIEYLGEGS